jgi:ribosomal protein S18 acetylase RimI-like enzyme
MKKAGHKGDKPPHIEIRQMEIDDLAPVFHLGEDLFTSQRVPNLYRMWDEFEVTSTFHEEPEFCFVAEADDRIVGFALGTTIKKPRSAWTYGHLVWLGVNQAYHRFKIATRLFNHFRDTMEKHGARILLIETDAENEQGIRLFEKMGFSQSRNHVYMAMNLETDG